MLARRALFGALLVTSCSRAATGARLHAHPGKTTAGAIRFPNGVTSLNLRPDRDALVHVPTSAAAASKPVPLVVYLHGATGNAQQGIRRMSELADEFGFVLLSPASEDGTWDAIRDGYGPDVRFLDQALAKVFERQQIDGKKVAVCGFSDGASYALGLGLSNGDLFGSVMAFSPGFIPAGVEKKGSPRFFISHGTKDQILPIDRCSRRLVPALKGAGYQVRFDEFDGPHAVPPEIARAGIEWMLG